MPLLRINGFGEGGLNTDREATLLQPGEWSRLDNIDIESGDLRSAWGDSLISADLPCEPRYLYVFIGSSGTWLIVSDGSRIYALDGTTTINITPTDTPQVDTQWDDVVTPWNNLALTWDDSYQPGGDPIPFSGEVTFSTFLGTLVVCTSEGVPCYWEGGGGRLQLLPGWDLNWRAASIHSYTSHLVVLGFDDGAVSGPQFRIAWSDAAAEGTLPQSWTPTPENLAGSVQLRDTDGYLVTALQLRNDLILYKQDSIYRMFLRGDEFVMGFERVISDHGCDSVRGVSAIGDVHFFVDRGDVRAFNGQTTQSVASVKIREALTATVSDEFRDQTIVVAYPEREQVWVAVVPAGSTTADIVLVYDLLHQAWSVKRYPGTVAMILGPFAATVFIPGSLTWDQAVREWDTVDEAWNTNAYSPSEDGIIFGKMGATAYRADKTNTDYLGNAKACVAERRGFLFADLDQNVTVRRVFPEMEGGPVQIEIGTVYHVGGPIQWSPQQTFTPGQQRKLNVRLTGQPAAFRIRSQQADGWRLGGLSFEVVPASRRGR